MKNLRTSVLLSVPSPLLSARANTLCAKATAASFDSVAASRTAVWSAAVAFVGVICALGDEAALGEGEALGDEAALDEGEDLGEGDAGAAPLAALPRFLGTRRGMRAWKASKLFSIIPVKTYFTLEISNARHPRHPRLQPHTEHKNSGALHVLAISCASARILTAGSSFYSREFSEGSSRHR